MELIVVKNYEEMSKKTATIIASQVVLKPNSVLGLATGETPSSILQLHKGVTIILDEAAATKL